MRDVPWREGGRLVGVLPVLAIFGANGSGKSNLLKAIDDMRRLVLTSFRFASPTGGVARRPFLLDAHSRRAPSRFDVDLVLADVRHTYGFEVDDDRVLSEWAYRYPRGRAALLFQRDGLDVELGSSAGSKGRAVTELLRPNALFLSTAAATNHPELTGLYEWFERNLLLAEADSRPLRQALTTELLADPTWRDQVLALLRGVWFGVTGSAVTALASGSVFLADEIDASYLTQCHRDFASEWLSRSIRSVATAATRGTCRRAEAE